MRGNQVKLTKHGSAACFPLALACFAGAGFIASMAGGGAFWPTGAAAATAEPGHIHLAQADSVPAEYPVSYTSDQADRGEEEYASECEECHGDDLRGGLNGGPPLRGVAFEQKFADGLPASVLYGFMSTAMPPNAPGRYSASTYTDLMAYILKRNGFNAGATLPSDLDALETLIMEK
jgi:S-disulfanyl-L-cysteine oxidoreductase SoxD